MIQIQTDPVLHHLGARQSLLGFEEFRNEKF